MWRKVQELDDCIRKFRSSAYASSTKATYSAQLRCYLQFCSHYSFSPAPVSTQNLARYVVHLTGFLAPSSVSLYLNIVRIYHLENGCPNPLEHFYITSLLKGVHRELSKPPTQKLPITPQILYSVFQVLDFQQPMAVTFWAACLVAFFFPSLGRVHYFLVPAPTAAALRYVFRTSAGPPRASY